MSHITGLFSRRGYNLQGILCGRIGSGETSKIYLLVEKENPIEQLLKYLENLYDVIEASHKSECNFQCATSCAICNGKVFIFYRTRNRCATKIMVIHNPPEPVMVVVKLKSGYANFVELKSAFEATQENADPWSCIDLPTPTVWRSNVFAGVSISLMTRNSICSAVLTGLVSRICVS